MTKLKIGQGVFVVDGFLDDYGQRGVITGLDYDAECGNLENDPLVIVTFEDGHEDGFWSEELALEQPQELPSGSLYIHSISK